MRGNYMCTYGYIDYSKIELLIIVKVILAYILALTIAFGFETKRMPESVLP
jgi:hypothetical protein